MYRIKMYGVSDKYFLKTVRAEEMKRTVALRDGAKNTPPQGARFVSSSRSMTVFKKYLSETPYLKKIFWIILFLIYAPVSFALQKDIKEKIYIISDSSIFNYKKGTNLFEGHVKADQGSTHITADKLITQNNEKHEIQEVIAYGDNEAAHYWTLPKVGDPEMHAHAKIIKFYPLTSNVVLEKKVVITQGENNFQGELVLYNMQDETITVPASANGRAVLVYNPEK